MFTRFKTATVVLAAMAVLLTAPIASAGKIVGKVSHKKAKGPLVVYVKKAPGKFKAKGEVMDQKGMKFIPKVLPVLKGAKVDFKNSDRVAHNVFSPDNEGYNLGTWPKGEARSYTFKKEGLYTQLCSLHPEMEAFVLVLQNPYFDVIDPGDSFSIDGVPDGKYEVAVWGKKLKKKDKKRTFKVNVSGGKADLDIEF